MTLEEKAYEYAHESMAWCEDFDFTYEIAENKIKQAYIAGAKENGTVWHKVADGDLPNTETMDYTYIRRRKRYEREFTEYKVIKCFVALVNEKGKTTAEIGYFDCKQKKFLDSAEGRVYDWKEIVLPEVKEK